MLRIWPLVLTATLGVVLGTVAGTSLLRRSPGTLYRQIVSTIILALGVFMLTQAGA